MSSYPIYLIHSSHSLQAITGLPCPQAFPRRSLWVFEALENWIRSFCMVEIDLLRVPNVIGGDPLAQGLAELPGRSGTLTDITFHI